MRHLLYYFILLLFLSCISNQDRELESVLNFSGNNRLELEKVLIHYQNDSLKLKAARFLILNMPGHGTYSNKNTELFYTKLDSLLPTMTNSDTSIQKINQLLIDTDVLTGLKWQEDVEHIKADFLINNIDRAFEAWQQEPFADHLSFDDFCEYILPYRINNEPLEYWRDSIIPHYNSIKNAGYYDGNEHAAFWACTEINDSLKRKHTMVLENDNWPLTKKYSALDKMLHGKCFDYSVLATYVMRAKGIPVMIDYTPQWPFRSLGHTWNVVKVNNGNNVIFGGVDSNPGQPHRPDAKMAKVYRRTYAINKESLVCKRKDEPIPDLFYSPFYIDVTSEYFKGANIELPIAFDPSQKRNFLYLHVFDNKQWTPVAYTEKKGRTALFTEMGKNNMYLPAYFINSKPEPANYPFLLDWQGKIHIYQPDMNKLKTLNLTRKFPFNETQHFASLRMIGGQIQGADRADFKDAQTIYTIQEDPRGGYVKVNINPEEKKFRYWRYLSPDHSNGNIAELEFFENDTVCNKKGIIVGTAGSHNNNPAYTKESAFDGNPLTFFDSPLGQENGSWVGMDFSQPRTINSIAYIPRNDDNNVSPGDEYELLYYGDKGWVSLGRKKATEYKITFDSVPDNAVLWLRDLTKGSEERIFTCEENRIRWW